AFSGGGRLGRHRDSRRTAAPLSGRGTSMHYLQLAIAIVAEVIGTTALKASDGFSRPLPSLLVVLGYGLAFYFMSLVIRTLPVGVTYAIWSGMGIVLITLVGVVMFRQVPDGPALIGMALIIAGVAVMNLFSKTVTG